MPLGTHVTYGRYQDRAVLTVPLDAVWCLVAFAGDLHPAGCLGPLFLARRAEGKADDPQ
jgi:hypothetical protein